MIKLNGYDVHYDLFPDNTTQVWKLPKEAIPAFVEVHKVEWNFSHESEFMQLAQLKTLLDRFGYKASLYLSYLPYGRQDKPVENTNTFALHTFATLLNSLKFEHITCLDPHSKVAGELINNFTDIYPYESLTKVVTLTKPNTICFPDDGAYNKYTNKYFFSYIAKINAIKRRNQQTGVIEDTHITEHQLSYNVKDRDILLVDDLVDGGATFIALTKLLKENGAKEVSLFVTHGIFSKGLKVLKDSGINRIFTHRGEISKLGDLGFATTPFDKIKE